MPFSIQFPAAIASRRARNIGLSVAALAMASIGASPVARAQFENFVIEAAPEWTALFDRTSGWTGADGIYSIPLDGSERYRADPTRLTAFVFSDTFIGEVDNSGRRHDTVMVNNTMALLTGSEPTPQNIRFHWGRDNQNEARAVFVPDTPNSEPGDWYWLGDGIVLNGKFHNMPARMRSTGGGGGWNFEVAGKSLISMPLNVANPFNHAEQRDTPFFLEAPSGGRGPIEYGACFMPNTAAAGAPFPDGYIYIYGLQNDQYIKKLLVARVLPEDFENFEAWRFWDGAEWQTDIDRSAELVGRVSSECSVTPLPNGKYLLVYQEDTLGPYVTVRIGDSPVGPFGRGHHIWFCEETENIPDAYTYNAKAHPSLSKPGELLISYNVNCMDFWYHFEDSSAYRPRFIRIRYTGG